MSQAIGTAIIKFVTGAAKVNAIVANVVGTAALMVGSNLLTPKARFGKVKERDSLNIRGINSRGSTDSRSYIYGQVRVGGTVVYMETTGTDNEFLHMVLVHCDHEVEELGDVYVNDVKVDFDTASEGSLRNAQGTRYRNSLYIADHLGGPSQTADSTLDAASYKWYSSDKLSGMAYTYIRMELKTGEDNAFPNGIPTFTRVVKGRKVYDPRLDSTQTGISGSGSHRADDSTTWEWSDNWALCVADYITSDFGYGRFGNGWSNINIQELADSADNCDDTVNQRFTNWSASEEVTFGTQRLFTGTGYSSVLRAESDGTTGTTEPSGPFTSGQTGITDGTTSWAVVYLSPTGTESRYTINGVIEADEDPLEVVKEMKGAAAGFIEYIGGSWVITSGRYQAPTITLTESDFAGPIAGTSKDDRTRSINGVRGVIANKDDAYNVIDVPPISSAAYVTEDNGVESFRDLKLLYTTSTSTAQRLFKIELNRARQALAFRSTFTASAFRLKAGDTFSLDFDRYGWSGKVFQVWSSQLKVGGDGELVVDMEFRETASTIYDYTASSDETVVDPAPNTSLPDPFDISNATGLTTTSSSATMIQTADGTIQPTIHVSWTAAASVNVTGYELRWERFVGQYEYMTLLGREVTSAVIYGVVEDSDYEVQIRSLTPVKTSAWSSVSTVTAIGKSAAPTAPTGFAATAIVEGVKLSMDEHPDVDFKQFLIYQNITNSKPGSHSYTTTDTTKTITGLTAGTEYFFWLEAEDTTAHTTAAASNVNATPTATAAGDVTGLGALATEDTVDLTTTGDGGVSGVLPTTNTDATDNGTTIDTSGNVNAAIDFTDSGAIKHGKTSSDDASNAGFWLGEDGQATPDYDFHIGDSSNSLKWDGSASTLTVKGDLTAGSVDIGSGLQRTQIDSNGTSSWGSGRIQINASDSFFGDVGQKWLGSPIESIWIDCNTTTLPARLYFGNTSTGSANAFITGQGNAEFKTLDVTTSLDLNSSTLDASNGVGSSGQVLSSTGSGTQWIDIAAGLWTESGSDIYYNTGDVGIGTTPSHTLHVKNTTSSGAYINYDGRSNGEFGLKIESNAAGGNFESDFAAGGTALLDLYANSAAVTGGDILVARTQSATPVLLVKGNGNVGISTASPSTPLQVDATGEDGILLRNDSSNNLTPLIEVRGRRSDTNNSQACGGGLGLTRWAPNNQIVDGNSVGSIYFGGAHGATTADEANILYTASIKAEADETWSSASDMATDLVFRTGSTGRAYAYNQSYGDTEVMRITHEGRVGIGTTGPTYKLDVDDDATSGNGLRVRGGGGGGPLARFERNVGASGMYVDINCNSGDPQVRFTEASGTDWAIGVESNVFEIVDGSSLSGGSSKIRVNSSGEVSIGTTAAGYKLRVEGTGYFGDVLYLGDVGSEGGELVILDQNNASTQKLTVDVDSVGHSRIFQAGNGNLHLGNLTGGTGETRLYCNADAKVRVKSTQTEITDQLYVSGYSGSDSIVTINGIDCGGGMLVQGSLDVDVNLDVSGSKNFRIAHPVREGYDLRHTCVESPQADLTYRGTATLVDGAVQVDLDSEFGMTAGTFAALNDEVQVFVQNESGWDAVRGSVNDGVLTIESQNTNSTDSVGWLVIGRRIGIELEIEPETKIK